MKRVRLSVVSWLLLVSSLLFLGGCDLFPYDNPISPARDLTGTWRNKLPGRGIEFIMGPDCPKGIVLEAWGDVELKLSQKGNDLTGTAQIYNFQYRVLTPHEDYSYIGIELLKDWVGFGRAPIAGRVSGTRFALLSGHGWTWEGTFTTDLMSGDLSSGEVSGMPPCFEIEGEFRVMRIQ